MEMNKAALFVPGGIYKTGIYKIWRILFDSVWPTYTFLVLFHLVPAY